MRLYGQDDDENYEPRRPYTGSRFGARLLFALGIAFFGLILYWSQTQKNPVTGEKQHVSLSPNQEIRLGLESAPQMSREMGGELPESDPRTQVVQSIGEKIVQSSEAENSPWQFKFHLLADTDTVNAFALPGGQIFITLGLYNALENEAELAGVLSHEIGHVIERHTAQQMAKSQLGQFFIMAVGVGASDGSHSYDPTAIAAFVNQMIQLRYSRGDESEADVWGIKLMEKAGYNPKAMIQVMEVLKKASGGSGRGPEIFQTHPNPDLRIQQIEEYLQKNPPKPGLEEGGRLPKYEGRSHSQPQSLLDLLQNL